MPQSFISKSKYLWGLQCPKLLWHAYNAKHLFPEPDAQIQAVFDQGHEIGALARQLFPTGIEIAPEVTDFDEVLALTQTTGVIDPAAHTGCPSLLQIPHESAVFPFVSILKSS